MASENIKVEEFLLKGSQKTQTSVASKTKTLEKLHDKAAIKFIAQCLEL